MCRPFMMSEIVSAHTPDDDSWNMVSGSGHDVKWDNQSMLTSFWLTYGQSAFKKFLNEDIEWWLLMQKLSCNYKYVVR